MKGAACDHYRLHPMNQSGVLCGALCKGKLFSAQNPSMELALEEGTQALVPLAEAASEQPQPGHCKSIDSARMYCMTHSPFNPSCMHSTQSSSPLFGSFKLMHPSVLAPAPLQMHAPPHSHMHSPYDEHFHDPHMHGHCHMHNHNPHHEHFHDPCSHMHSHNPRMHSHSQKHPLQHIEPHPHCMHLHPLALNLPDPSLHSTHFCGTEVPHGNMCVHAIQSQGEADCSHMAFHDHIIDSHIYASHNAPAALDMHAQDCYTVQPCSHRTVCVIPHAQHDHACEIAPDINTQCQHHSTAEAYCPAINPQTQVCHMVAVDNAEVRPCCEASSVVDVPEQTCNMASEIMDVSPKALHHTTSVVDASNYISSHDKVGMADAHAQVIAQTRPHNSPDGLVRRTRELHSLWWSSDDSQRASMVEAEKKVQTQGTGCWRGVSIAKEENIKDKDFWKGSSFAEKGKKMETNDFWKGATTYEKNTRTSNENCWKGEFKKDTQTRRQNWWKGTHNGKQTNAKEGRPWEDQANKGFWKGAPFEGREKNTTHNAKPWGGQHGKRKAENFAVNQNNSMSTWDDPRRSSMNQEEPITSKDCDGWGDPTEESNRSAGWDSKQTTLEIHVGSKESNSKEPVREKNCWDGPGSSNKGTIQEDPITLKACNGWGAPNESCKSAVWEETPMVLKQATSKIPVGSKQSTSEEPIGANVTWEEPTGFAKSFGGGPVSLNNNAWEGDEPFGPSNRDEFLTTTLTNTFVGPTERNWKKPLMKAQKFWKEPESKNSSQGGWFKPPADGKTKGNEKRWLSPANEKRSNDAEGTWLQEDQTSTWPNDSTVGTLCDNSPALCLPESKSGCGEPSTRITVEDSAAVPLIEERKEASLMPHTHKATQEMTAMEATQEVTAMEFLSSSSDDRESGDDLYYESDGEAQHPKIVISAQSNAKLRENQAYEFFMMIFEESEELRKMYKDEYNVREFECFVCSGIPNKPLKRYNSLLSVVMHAQKILNTKRLSDHRGYARAVCDIMGWDANGNPIAPTTNVEPRACLVGPVGAEQEHKDSDTDMADLENAPIVNKDGLGLEFEERQNEGVTKINQNASEDKIVLKERPTNFPSVFSNKEEAYKAFREQVLDKTFGLGKMSFDKDNIHKEVDEKYKGKEASGFVPMGEVEKGDVGKNEMENTSDELLLEDEKLIEGQEGQSQNEADAHCKDVGDKDESSEVISSHERQVGES